MTIVRLGPIGLAAVLLLSSCPIVACQAIAGIGDPVLETSDGSTPGQDDAGKPDVDANGLQPGPDAGDSGGDGDGGLLEDANVADSNVPDTFTPPPPVAAKPGFDLTAGGTYGTSKSYALIGVVGESPGGNNVAVSKSYVLKAGVIAVTQPN